MGRTSRRDISCPLHVHGTSLAEDKDKVKEFWLVKKYVWAGSSVECVEHLFKYVHAGVSGNIIIHLYPHAA